MSVPVITGLRAPATAVVGTPFEVDILAEDPSARQVTLNASVANAAGETATQSTTVDVSSGPVTFTLTSDDPSVVITAGADPGTFTVVA